MIKNSIVLVPFPFDNFSEIKVRPALCLTNEIGDYEHIIIAFISSKIPEQLYESDCVIIKGTSGWTATGLIVDSVIRLHKIISIPKSLIKRRLGQINQDIANKVKSKLKQVFER